MIDDFTVAKNWHPSLDKVLDSPQFIKLKKHIETSKETIYPEAKNYFKALQLTPFDKVKVIILGQDPYHNKGQAIGLSFAVDKSQKKLPPSLNNIYKETFA